MTRVDNAAPRRRTAKRKGVSPLTLAGVLLLVIGLGCLGYIGWQYLGTNVVAQRAFSEQRTDLREQWERPDAGSGANGANGANNPTTTEPESAMPGDAVALMRIPRLGDDYEVPVLKGTDVSTLARGLGWYEDTASPGEIGNFAVAGHRVTHGEPFAKLLELDEGDTVIVETRSAIYTYTLNRAPKDLTVDDSETWPLDPVPGESGDQTPTEAILTLTTCTDLFRSPDRSIGFAVLTSTETK